MVSTSPASDDLTIGRTFRGAPRRLTRTDFVRYAGISGDFNPMHHDEVRAQAAGQPSVFGHGMFSAGLVATELTDRFGLQQLRMFRVRFTRPVRPDEVVTTVLTVRDVRTVDGVPVADLDCVLTADAGDVVRGSAEVAIG